MTLLEPRPGRAEARPPRAAAQLKARSIDAQQHDFAAALAWARSSTQIEAAAMAITRSRRRFVLGAATSFTYASLLASKLSDALAKVTVVDGTIVRPLDILTDVRDSDTMIVFSLRRYRRYTIDSAVPFVRAGGSLVLITDSEDCPLMSYATEAVVMPASEAIPDEPGTVEVSATVVALVIDLLAGLAAASAKGAGRRVAARDRLASELGLFVDP